MAQGFLIPKSQAAGLVGRSTRWIERHKEALEPEQVGLAANGKPELRYDVARVVELAPREDNQLGLELVTPAGPNLSEADRAEAERRYGAIEALIQPEKYHLLYVQHQTRAALIDYLAAAHKVAPRTLYHWLKCWKRGGLPELVAKDRSDKGKPRRMNQAAWEFLCAAAMPRRGVYGALSIREIFRAYEEERGWRASHAGRRMGEFEVGKYERYIDEDGRLRAEAMLPEVSYETFRTWLGRIPEVARVMAREGLEAFRNKEEILSFREISATDPLDYVIMDHRVLDIFCMIPTRGGWRLARPWLTAAIDMRTRKWLAWGIFETPSSDSIATVLKRVFLDYGLPKLCYWDNGRDFRCEWLEGGHHKEQTGRVGELDGAWRGVLGTLGIRVVHAIVRNARAKLIEPNFKRVANFDRQLPEWCGHKPGVRPERFAAMVKAHEAWVKGERQATPFRTIQQIADLYAGAIDDLNERDLEGEGMQKATPSGRGWMCPNEAWEILIRRVERRTIPAEVLHLCFARRRDYTVQHGEISISRLGRTYHYRMDNPIALMALNGQTVELAYDPLDLGEAAVYARGSVASGSKDATFVGIVHCVELRRMGEQAFVEDERDRRAARREVKRAIAALSGIPVASPEERLLRRREVLPERVDVPRVEIPVALPEPIEAAVAARAAERDFRFEATDAAAVERLDQPSSDDGDDEFHFFQGD